MIREDSHFRLRIPADLKERLEKAAKDAGRSINAQVLVFLEMALGQEDVLKELENSHAHLQRQVDVHDARLRDLERRMADVFHMSGWQDYPGN